MFARSILFIGLLLPLAGTAAQAQVVGRLGDVQASGVSYHTYARPGEATVQILVLGDVPSGIYEIAAETRLDEFLALMGGAGDTSPGVTRKVSVRLLRDGGAGREVLYKAPMDDVLLYPDRHPDLLDGDILDIEVKQRERFGWRDGLQILTSATSLIILIDRLARIW